MENKGTFEREEKDRSDFLTFLRNAVKRGAREPKHPAQGEKFEPEKRSQAKGFPECHPCDLMSRNASFLAEHKQNGHMAVVTNMMSFSCGHCNFASFGRNGLAMHISAEHEKENMRILSIGCRRCNEGQIHSI